MYKQLKKNPSYIFYFNSPLFIIFLNHKIDFFTDSEKFHEMAAAADSPPKQCFLLDDDGEFPPMNKAGHKA